jgi:hypothetical protein
MSAGVLRSVWHKVLLEQFGSLTIFVMYLCVSTMFDTLWNMFQLTILQEDNFWQVVKFSCLSIFH